MALFAALYAGINMQVLVSAGKSGRDRVLIEKKSDIVFTKNSGPTFRKNISDSVCRADDRDLRSK
jgi:hypothetical protein